MTTEDLDFIERLNKRDPEVFQGFKVFEDYYKNSFRSTYVSEIIKGENIKIKPDNIRVDEPVDESIVPIETIDKLFNEFCKKKLYEYQRQAILKILELEEKQEHVDPVTGHTIVHNGLMLNLPIGSGKSLIFMGLALFFNSVKIHPIIISTDGRSINEFEHVSFEKYPFYYENCAYDKNTVNAVQVIKTDLQRKCTVILTYEHLLSQIKQYFQDDFDKSILKMRKILYINYQGLKPNVDIEDVDILVVVSDEYNVNRLVDLSYQKPFARVIIDDYTNMADLPKLRQILTYSFIPVSGSGFEGSIDRIPSSYYSLKNVPSEKIKLVGDPHKTYEGVMRSNIITGEILTSKSDFDVYSFVSMVEEMVSKLPGCEKMQLSDFIGEFETSNSINTFIKYGFFIQNMPLFKSMIPGLIQDLESGKADEKAASHFIDWFNNTKDIKFKNLLCSPNPSNQAKSITTLVNSPCIICKDPKDKTFGFGIISSCCGAFICSKCIKMAATKEIVNSENLKDKIIDKENSYCVCCRDKNPRYFFNSTQHSIGVESRSYLLAEKYFENSECEKHYSIDYYFYMMKNGFKLRDDCCCGQAINVYRDIQQKLISPNIFKTKTIPVIEKVRNGDLLFPNIITAIFKTYQELELAPVDNSTLLVYKCKEILKPRIMESFTNLQNIPNSPFTKTRIVFSDSVGSVIGLSMNIIGIIVYDKSNEEDYSMLQLIGRLLRISAYGQKILFYIENNTNAYV